MSVEQLQRAMGFTRVVGIAIVLICAFAASGPDAVSALDTCNDYTMQECIPEEQCFEQAGQDCGYEHWNPACHGAGYKACGYNGCSHEGGIRATLVCMFEPN